MKKIIIINKKNLTKTGKLKKTPVLEWSMMSGGITTEKEKKWQQNYEAKTIKERGYHSFSSPYFFTHIDALNADNEPVMIFESVTIGNDNKEINTSPVTLLKLLTQ